MKARFGRDAVPSRLVEAALWIVALVLLLAGWSRWRRAVPEVDPPAAAVDQAAPDLLRPPRGRLSTAARVVAAVENDERAVYYPGLVRLLRIVHGISPRLGDLMLRRMRGTSAAPRTG